MSVYLGTKRKLVLAFDVGTTYSGISYSVLDPGEVPEIRGINRYPAQEQVGGDSKIPTVIYYDVDGKVCAVGAEATYEGIEGEAIEKGWKKAEWFKMHLRPNDSAMRHSIPPLPANKTVVDVMGDYLHYLHYCAKVYIQETHPGGVPLWLSLEENVQFVLSHPNGWEGAQQAQMRRAAILGGLVHSEEDAAARISCVTEGEASLHFCIRNGLCAEVGSGVVIVDAGGGTIDISAYSHQSERHFEETAPAQCHLLGSIFITQHARGFLRDLLEDSKYADDVDFIAERFDNSTKLRFKNAHDPAFIKFGNPKDHDAELGIRSGQLRLNGSDVASFFDPSVRCIVHAILEMQESLLKRASRVFLVGGFGASDYLFAQLKQSLEKLHLELCRPDTHVNKAVADGAVSFYIDHFVSVRVSRRMYGCTCSIRFEPSDPEHVRRASETYNNLAGETRVGGTFDVVLPKNVQVSEKKEFRRSYSRQYDNPSSQFNITVEILGYHGHNKCPQWLDTDSNNFSIFCTITANIPRSCAVARKAPGSGRKYHLLQYDVILAFGLSELQAQVAWMENGKEKRGSARVVYDEV